MQSWTDDYSVDRGLGILSPVGQNRQGRGKDMTLFLIPPGRCQVRVLPPVPTEGLTPDDVPALADRVRHSMLTIFREISTDGLGGGDCLKKPGGAVEARL